MRWVIVVFGLCIGLITALIAFGEVGHLRRVAPDRLPDWTSALSNRSGIVSGRAEIAALGPLPGPVLATWRWHGLDGLDPAWRITLDGPTFGGGAIAAADIPPDTLRVTSTNLSLDLAALSANQPALSLAGQARFDALDAALRVKDRRLVRLRGDGRLFGVSFDGRTIGDGTFQLTGDVGGAWRLGFVINGTAATIEGRLSGRYDLGGATLEALIAPGPDMPPDWASQLSLLYDQDENGRWRVTARLPF